MTEDVTIYVSDPDEAIERLAELDGATPPTGPLLVATLGAEPIAALPLDGSRAIADPFQRTAELVALLELRLTQMSGRPRSGRLARLLAGLRPGASDGLAARA